MEFTKEQLQQIIETDHVQCGEASSLARIALASIEAEPAGWQVKKYGGNWVSIKKEDVDHYRFNEELPVREVYTAPPAPVSVPDERAAFEAFMEKRFKDCIDRRLVKSGDGEYFAWDMQVAWIVWQERASMLHRSEPETDNTNQQFESLCRDDK